MTVVIKISPMVFIPLLSQFFTYKLFPFLRCELNHNGALRTDLISSGFTSLQKSAQLIKTSFLNGFLIFIAKLLAYSPPNDKTLSKSIWFRMCQVVLFTCWITLPNQDILKDLMKEYIWGILNRPEDKFLIATFLVILSGPAFPKKLKKKHNF